MSMCVLHRWILMHAVYTHWYGNKYMHYAHIFIKIHMRILHKRIWNCAAHINKYAIRFVCAAQFHVERQYEFMQFTRMHIKMNMRVAHMAILECATDAYLVTNRSMHYTQIYSLIICAPCTNSYSTVQYT